MTKSKVKRKYKNIPVKPEVYLKVKVAAEAAGFGERGLGALVNMLVSQELPECTHQKTPVEIEYYGDNTLPGTLRKRAGYYCQTCQRVYARINETVLMMEDGGKLLKAVQGMVEDE